MLGICNDLPIYTEGGVYESFRPSEYKMRDISSIEMDAYLPTYIHHVRTQKQTTLDIKDKMTYSESRQYLGRSIDRTREIPIST